MYTAQVAAAKDEGAALKAVYALGQLLRLSRPARSSFYSQSGLRRMRAVMGADGASLRLQRKAVSLVTDLIEVSLGAFYGSPQEGQQDGGGGDARDAIPDEHQAQFVGAALQFMAQVRLLWVGGRRLCCHGRALNA